MSERTRRELLKTTGIGVATSAGLATVGSARTGGPDDEVLEQVRRLLFEGREEQARRLADRHDVGYSFAESYLGSESGGGDGVSTQSARYGSPEEESGTRLLVGVREDRPDVYEVLLQWRLVEYSDILNPDNGCPDDGAAIFWNQNYWQPVDVGRDNFYNGGQDRVNYGEYSPDGGVLARVNDEPIYNDGSQDEFTAGFYTFIEKVRSGAEDYPFKGQYVHNYINTLTTICGAVSVSLGLGPGSIQVDGDVKNWTMAEQNSP